MSTKICYILIIVCLMIISLCRFADASAEKEKEEMKEFTLLEDAKPILATDKNGNKLTLYLYKDNVIKVKAEELKKDDTKGKDV